MLSTSLSPMDRMVNLVTMQCDMRWRDIGWFLSVLEVFLTEFKVDAFYCFVSKYKRQEFRNLRQNCFFNVLRTSGFIKEIRTNSLSIRKLNG